MARDLLRHRGRSLVLAGERQPPAVHLLAHALNEHLGNVGETVLHTAPIEAVPVDQAASLSELVADMQAERVEVLVILGGNPVYTAPAGLNFTQSLQQVPCAFTSASTWMKQHGNATGTFPKRIISKPGAIRALSMAQQPSPSH